MTTPSVVEAPRAPSEEAAAALSREVSLLGSAAMENTRTWRATLRNGVERARSRAFDVAMAGWTALFAPVILCLWACGSPPRAVRRATRVWSRGVLALLKFVVGLGYREVGRENVPAEPCLIIANHQSAWETLASLALFPEVAIVAKRELLRIPVFGWFLSRSPMIVIDRESGSSAVRKMVAESRAALEQGRSILIFPEGTRANVGDRVAFKRGVELLYATLGRPVVPMALNSGRFWGLGLPYKRPGTIVVNYLPAIPAGLRPSAFVQQAEEMLELAKG